MEKEYMSYVERNVVDDKDELYTIVEATNELLSKAVDILIEPPEMLIATVMETFKAFKLTLQERSEKGYNRFKINVANRFEIGYDDAVNEDYEKNGGFMFYIKHLYRQIKDDDYSREFEDDSITLCTTWNSMNIKVDVKIINEISNEAIKLCKKIGIKLENQEVVMPILCAFYDAMILFVEDQRKSLGEFEYMINIASIFDIRVIEGDDGENIITFTPGIEYKLGLKNDANASSKYDE